jgi:hypothetical protein
MPERVKMVNGTVPFSYGICGACGNGIVQIVFGRTDGFSI